MCALQVLTRTCIIRYALLTSECLSWAVNVNSYHVTWLYSAFASMLCKFYVFIDCEYAHRRALLVQEERDALESAKEAAEMKEAEARLDLDNALSELKQLRMQLLSVESNAGGIQVSSVSVCCVPSMP